MAEGCCSFQLISGNGVLDVEGLEKFMKTTNLSQCGISYAVVAIMGPQSGGKSTLLNHLFETNFCMMNPEVGRSQTTRGIWVAKASKIEPFTIAMDIEGSDSSERAKDPDGVSFENQSALFALAIADIVIINMWCQDIGREQAANRPLLKRIFTVMMKLFGARKTTLLFVIRDKTKTPLEILEGQLRNDIEQLWATTAKPEDYRSTPLDVFFKVEITALPHYEHEHERFNDQVSRLRHRFFHSISPGGLAGERKDIQPASGFLLRAQEIWKTIKENKDLDLPALEVMVSTFRCQQIVKEKLESLKSDKTWLEMKENPKAVPVLKFREKISSVLDNYLSQYDSDASHHQESIRNENRQDLETEALKVLYPAYDSILQHQRSIAFLSSAKKLYKKVTLAPGNEFQGFVKSRAQSSLKKFDKICEDAAIRKEWDASEVREGLRRDIEKTQSETIAKYHEVTNTLKGKTVSCVAQGVGSLTGAVVATATWLGDLNKSGAKQAGDSASLMVRKLIKRAMLKLEHRFTALNNTNPKFNAPDNSHRIREIADDSPNENVDDSADCENTSAIVVDSDDESTDDSADCENTDAIVVDSDDESTNDSDIDSETRELIEGTVLKLERNFNAVYNTNRIKESADESADDSPDESVGDCAV